MKFDIFENQKSKKFLHFHLSMITCIILGNVARNGVTQLADYEPAYIKPVTVLWSNATGSALMGLLQAMNAETGWFTKYPILFTALTTGFCGSFSSFSTMMLEAFEHSTNLTPENIKYSTKLPNRAYGIMEFLSVLITHISVSMTCLIFGRFLATEIVIKYASIEEEAFDQETKTITRRPHALVNKIMRTIFYINMILAPPLLILFIVLTAYYDNYSRGIWTLPSLFGIFGAFLRYHLSNWLNPKSKYFKWGTFAANVLATLLAAIFTIVLRGKNDYNTKIPVIHTKNACHIVSALLGGFCGSLSTISTFINEGYLLPLSKTIIYYGATIATSFILIVITLGSYSWTRGLTAAYC